MRDSSLSRPQLRPPSGSGIRIQDLAHLLRKLNRRKRLLQEAVPFCTPSFNMMSCVYPDMKHDFHAGPQVDGVFRELASTELGHDHIGQKQIDGALVGFAHRQTFAPIGGFEEPRTRRFPESCVPVRGLSRRLPPAKITSEPLGALSMRRPKALPWAPPRPPRAGRWKRRCPVPARTRLGLAPDCTAALFYNSQNGGKAEAGSFAGLFGGEERLEDKRLHLRVYPNPTVVHCQRDIAPRLKVLLRSIFFMQIRGSSLMVRVPPSGIASRAFGNAWRR